MVDLTHPDSNHFLAHTQLLSKVAIPSENVNSVKTSLSPKQAAMDYQTKISLFLPKNKLGIPVFDVVLLGVGPDGHTCSLFPEHALLDEKVRLIAEIEDSPKLPPKRVTFTFPLLDAADNVFFVMSGANKADIVKSILVGKADFPAGRVNAQNVTWVLDQGAASMLTPAEIATQL